MWKAAGADEAKRPANWARKDGAEFIVYMEAVLNVPLGHIISGTRGRAGSTYAHWQIALAYAKYPSPEFHAACNVAIRERMEGRHRHLPLAVRSPRASYPRRGRIGFCLRRGSLWQSDFLVEVQAADPEGRNSHFGLVNVVAER